MTEEFFVPPGHFYSPIPSLEDRELALRQAGATASSEVDGLNLNADAMVALWRRIAPRTLEMPFGDEKGAGGYRYHFANDMYSYGDSAIYFGLVWHLQPRRIIEIGSGYSSALALDMRDVFRREIALTFIEPYPNTLNGLLREADRSDVTIIEDKVQNVPVHHFESLEANDILFIDSSHVVKAGSDVSFEIFNILPKLQPGVVVHFHDCFWPFEYPKDWLVEQNRGWNELYFLRAFLLYNNAFEIIFFNSYFAARHHKEVAAYPRTPVLKNPGGGLWLRKNI
ncbi:class I SAM-dependent methyltransferase [Mesorhizobium atlanticum]|uniref:Class I SAM-dependent methyltransferase n=1 Tax=Mesorhizobium atlanticum TaxID=2233532 RepID=A0A330H0L4_9HYPH|nr:class I SAM-dependent methyltransferase [Mesorhizobium atlanticum]RAZ80293.1 class I SAM-dependent methyltransferase [Mesorhizobium atlanticum]